MLVCYSLLSAGEPKGNGIVWLMIIMLFVPKNIRAVYTIQSVCIWIVLFKLPESECFFFSLFIINLIYEALQNFSSFKAKTEPFTFAIQQPERTLYVKCSSVLFSRVTHGIFIGKKECISNKRCELKLKHILNVLLTFLKIIEFSI
jgi:hypothetical protein